MTRLTSKDVKNIPRKIIYYDRFLQEHLGYSLKDIACLASNFEGKVNLNHYKAKVVPITAGKGIIKGFTEAVSAILNYVGLNASISQRSDVGGFAEALEEGCNVVFAADDDFFVGFNFQTLKCSYNFDATGRAYAAVIEIKAGKLKGTSVSVLGAGRVGSAAIEYLCKKGAKVHVYDPVKEKVELLKRKYPEFVLPCKSTDDCLNKSDFILIATPAKDIIHEHHITSTKFFSVPAIPMGFTKAALKRIPEGNLIHDSLELGVATMALDLVKF